MAHPAYDQCIKASHLFNLLDARGVISVTERQAYIGRVRALAKACADAFRADRGRGQARVNLGRIFVLFILVSAALAGAGLYYLQVYGYYTELTPEDAARQTVTLADGTQVPLEVTEAQAIDATSSPIR